MTTTVRINVPTREQVAPKSQAIFDTMQKSLGMVPNLYAIIGHSSNALESYVAFSNAQAKGTFNAKEREAIYLAVSQTNGCNYCLAAHTTIAKMNGFSEEATLQLRTGTIDDEKLRILTKLSISLIKNRGTADPDLVEAFFALGYNEGALIDLVALIIDKTFTNFVGRLTSTPLDFPAAPKLP